MRILFIAFYIVLSNLCLAQTPIFSTEQLQQLQKDEEAAKEFSVQMIRADESIDRYKADSFFTRTFVKALRNKNSFFYSFDSIKTVSKLYAPDSTFKIFTWQIMKDFTSFRQRGAIQMRTADGSLKLIPLFDYSDYAENVVDSVRTTKTWIGALYYNIILTTFNNKKYYTLLGYDDNNAESVKKYIEVLTFDAQGNPQFGGRYFQYPNDEIKPPQPAFRFCLEYKKQGRARMMYDSSMNAIIFEHLMSESNTPDKKSTLIPDGDYEAFKWNQGRWVHVNKVFDFKIDMQGVDPMHGNPPVPKPLNEKKLPTPESPFKVNDKKKPTRQEKINQDSN